MCLLFFFSHFRSELLFLCQPGMFLILSLGSLSNDDGDGNENGIKANRFQLGKKTTLHVHHAFSYISMPSLHDYNGKVPIRSSGFQLFLLLKPCLKLFCPFIDDTVVKVVEHSFGSLWVYVICQIMARERLQLTSWNLASEKYTDERFWLTGKTWRFRSFHGNMNDWIQP